MSVFDDNSDICFFNSGTDLISSRKTDLTLFYARSKNFIGFIEMLERANRPYFSLIFSFLFLF